MKLSNEFIENNYKKGVFSREEAFELLSNLGFTDDCIEYRLDAIVEDRYNMRDKIDDFIEKEKLKEISFLHSSITDEDDIRYFLLRFTKEIVNNI